MPNESNSSALNIANSSHIEYLVAFVYYFNYVACGFASVTNVVNILVFMSPKLKDPIYTFMLVNSIAEFLISSFSGVGVAFTCGAACTGNLQTRFGQVYVKWILNYSSRVLAVYNIQNEMFISFQRLMLIKNKKFFRDTSVALILTVLFVVSVFYYLPLLFMNEIVQTYSPLVHLHNSTQIDLDKSSAIYVTVLTSFGSGLAGKVVTAILTIIRILFATVFLFLVNGVSAFEFRKHIIKKRNISALSKFCGIATGPRGIEMIKLVF